MVFTALHRHLGRPPGPLTDDFIEEAVAAGLAETDDLDWKSELPPAKGLPQTDLPKDVAAMANSGGGIIVYGVTEDQKKANGRSGVGFDEGYERAIRSATITAISPPVFGLGVYALGEPGQRAVAVVVPASADGPHLIYRGEYFGAPIRNGADTVWMRERQVEAMYRARFNERRHATETLTSLYDEAAAGRDTAERAWLIAIGHPRLPPPTPTKLTRYHARAVFERAQENARVYAGGRGLHPLEAVDRLNPRPGLRRWTAVNATAPSMRWREAWASLHQDGSVSLAAAIGGHRTGEGHLPGERIDSAAIEFAVAALMAMVRAMSEYQSTSEYDVRVGIEWAGEAPLTMQFTDPTGFVFDGASVPLARYTPVDLSVVADAAEPDFHWLVHDLAEDCINQGGVTHVRFVRPDDD